MVANPLMANLTYSFLTSQHINCADGGRLKQHLPHLAVDQLNVKVWAAVKHQSALA